MKATDSKFKIIVICGPTGVGKTATAIRAAKSFNGEIIGADSMQIYRHMDIGTAKPTRQEQAAISHHMIDVVEPNQSYDAAQYAEMAHQKVKQLHRRKKRAFIVGGTGLYIRALINGLFSAAPADPEIRKQLNQEACRLGNKPLYERLCKIDSQAAAAIHPHDTYRIVRALETYAASGTTISEYHRRHRSQPARFNALKIGLCLDRKTLYERIDRRVDAMLDQGLKAEVERLLLMGFSPVSKSMQSLGYRHILAHIQGKASWDEVVRTMKRDHRRYAKRQFTWFNADPQIKWVEPHENDKIIALIRNFLAGR
jgi:tRNA dimethylallyltransferase